MNEVGVVMKQACVPVFRPLSCLRCFHLTSFSSCRFQPISYAAEGFVAVSVHIPAAAHALTALNSTVAWVVRNQSADGTWGILNSADGERSPRCATLLQWYSIVVHRTEEVEQAIARYLAYLLVPANSVRYGVNTVPLPTGFVGLVMADALEPWATFGPSGSA